MQQGNMLQSDPVASQEPLPKCLAQYRKGSTQPNAPSTVLGSQSENHYPTLQGAQLLI